MANHIDGIDHVLVAVRDLAAARALWTRLGFTLTPRGGHPQWGTANHCIMFADDYVELIGAIGAGAKADGLRTRLDAGGEGVSGLAFATADATAAAAGLRRAGLAVGEPAALNRALETPEGEVQPRFAVLDLPDGILPGATTFLCQHLTPALLRRPEWLDHANGAIAVLSLTLAVDDPEAVRPGLEAVFGAGSTTGTDSTVAVHTGRGLILLARPDEVSQLHPECDFDEPPPSPSVVALTLAVDDPARTAAHLAAQDVPFSRDSDGTLRIAAEDASGVFLEFCKR